MPGCGNDTIPDMRQFTAFMLILSFFPWLLFSGGGEGNDGRILARVNGVPVTARDLQIRMKSTINRTYFHGNLPPEKETQIRRESLDRLIEEELFHQDALKRGIKPNKKAVNREYEKVVARFSSKRIFKDTLKKAGMDEKQLRQRLERDVLIREVQKRQITDRIRVTEQDLRDYYQNNTGKFIKPESVRLQLIFLRVKDPVKEEAWDEKKASAAGLADSLRSGADFAELARRFSDDRYRIKGGHLGEVHRGRLPGEIEKVAFTMTVGEISDPIRTPKGYAIIKVLGRRRPLQLGFDEVKIKLKKDLEKKYRTEERKRWLGELKTGARIEVFTDQEGQPE